MSNIRSLHGGSTSDVVYFEKQDTVGRYCGLHCLNNLLQGPHYNVEIVSAVGLTLDAEERRLMRNQSTGEEYRNASHDGFYSVAVIEQSLAMKNFVMTRFGHPTIADLRYSPAKYSDGFICNSQKHWFAIRCVNGRYFRLDSLAASPEAIATSALSKFIDSLQDGSYSVFVIRPTNWPNAKLPNPTVPVGTLPITQASQLRTGGVYMTFALASKLQEEGLNGSGSPAAEKTASGPSSPQQPVHTWPTGEGHTVGGSFSKGNTPQVDADMLEIMLVSAQEFRRSLPDPPPPPSSGGIMFKIIDINNISHVRRFAPQNVVRDLFLWVHKDDNIMADALPALASRDNLSLVAQFPRRVYQRIQNGLNTIVLDTNGKDVTETPLASVFPQGEALRLQLA
eukprot:Blabericola_migrator_1__7988@NODE_409_length_8743_cov_452_402259_g322_i0_p5_GENE_NODE_409_length_8743_cov_452_402259_g322_i0NODE_409_length_8743_cov_452_402259_g322_i0_p5_ORF_typecomplete_len395_score42_97Josephin/PF02099_17/4_7e30UBX/PF00789_20/0_026_NODE_409_length_8743_cov_452_402259_g322_i068428026